MLSLHITISEEQKLEEYQQRRGAENGAPPLFFISFSETVSAGMCYSQHKEKR